MTKQYNATRNRYFVMLLANEPFIYEREPVDKAKEAAAATVLTGMVALCENTMYYKI